MPSSVLQSWRKIAFINVSQCPLLTEIEVPRSHRTDPGQLPAQPGTIAMLSCGMPCFETIQMPLSLWSCCGPGHGGFTWDLAAAVMPCWLAVVSVISDRNNSLDETILFILPSHCCLGIHHLVGSESTVSERVACALVIYAV